MSTFYTNIERLGDDICIIGYEDGRRFKRKEKFRPNIFLIEREKPTSFKTLDGLPVAKFCAGGMRDSSDFIRKYEDVDNFHYYGMTNWIYNYIAEKFPGKIEYIYDLFRIGFIDIETECENGFPDVALANERILAITIWFKNKFVVFGLGDYKPHLKQVIYKKFDNEKEMLLSFLTFWEKLDLDIISGWYSELFDIPYMVNRLKRLFDNNQVNRLSPWGKVTERKIPGSFGNDTTTVYEMMGISHVDYLAAYKKFGEKQQENYRLDTVAYDEVGSKKLDYKEYGSLHELYRSNFQKFIEYNIRDVELLVQLDQKKKLLELIVDLMFMTKVNIIDVFKQTRMWDSLIHYALLEKNIVIPQRPKISDKTKFAGAYVKETKPGMYDWIVSLDLDSLYPHLIKQYNISPETYLGKFDISINDLLEEKSLKELDYIREKNLTLAANGSYYRKDIRGILPELMDKLYGERKAIKQDMLKKTDILESQRKALSKEEIKQKENEIAKLDIFQKVRKRTLNSAYGSIGNPGFRYFFRDQAEGITTSGQLSILWAEKKLNALLNKLCDTKDIDFITAVDTDSVHICMDPLVQRYKASKPDLTNDQIVDFLDKFAEKKLQPFIDQFYKELAENMNAYEQAMHMKRESIAQRGFYTAKKRYAYYVNNLEGVAYDPPKMKITGIEVVRSSTPEFCRDKLKEACEIVLTKNEKDLKQYIDSVKKDFLKLSPNDIATPTGINGINIYGDSHQIYKKGTPIHVRGALLFNNLVKQKKLQKTFKLINDGDKIKFLYLLLPNPIFENVIAFPSFLPDEFNLISYIDYETQFEKAFMSPLNTILEAINWNISDKVTLDDLWS